MLIMRNRFFLFLFLCIWISNSVFCQFRGTVFESKLIDMDVSVSLFKNAKYLIILEFMCDGNIYDYGLSMGNYLYSKDTVICTDVYYNYSLKFLRKGKELQPIKSFPFMNGKLISYNADFEKDYAKFSNNLIDYYKCLGYNKFISILFPRGVSG